MRINIRSVEICDNNRELFPMSPVVPKAFRVRFRPEPLGTTGNIYLRVVCALIPAEQAQVFFKLCLNNLDGFKFAMGNRDGSEIDYCREVITREDLYLPLEIQNIRPLSLIANLSLTAKSSERYASYCSPFLAYIHW